MHMLFADKTLGFWARKLLHLFLNGCIAIAALFVTVPEMKTWTVLGFIAVLIFESVRLKTQYKQFLHETVGPLFKTEEALEYSGMFWAAVGALIIALFARPLAFSYGFAVLAVSDAGAAMVGRLWPYKPFYMNKTVSGAIACFVLSAAVTFVYLHFAHLAYPLLPSMVIMGSIVTLLELFSFPFDDNFLILVSTAFLMNMALGLV